MTNSFIKANTLDAGANDARTENGAVSYATTGKALLDQFAQAAAYRGRDLERVWTDQSALWDENPESALKFPFYLRMITRQTNVLGGEKTKTVQKGAGARDESFKRLLWIAKYHPDEFYRNLWLLPVIGSWKDLWILLAFDGADEYLDEKKFFQVIAEGISDERHRDLIKKYLPRIRSEKKCKTPWAIRTNNLAKHFAKTAGWSFREYREYKATGTAHEFQTIICRGIYSNINWNQIPGKALLNLVSGKFLDNHNLTENYLAWLDKQPVAKFNGYPFELARKISNWRKANLTVQKTVDKQFNNLIAAAEKDGAAITGNTLCALDTSDSMTWFTLDDAGTTPLEVCLSLGIYFATLNKGAFHNVVVKFSTKSTLFTLEGESFTNRYRQLVNSDTACGNTNFQSVIDLLVETRKKHPEIPLADYPTNLLVVSDMQFDSVGEEKSNYQAAQKKLYKVFPSEFVRNFKIIWWYCRNGQTDNVPSTMEDGGTYVVSGYDGAVISFILGGDIPEKDGKKKMPSMEEVVDTALNQEVLGLIK